jgi:hypothetical protein
VHSLLHKGFAFLDAKLSDKRCQFIQWVSDGMSAGMDYAASLAYGMAQGYIFK